MNLIWGCKPMLYTGELPRGGVFDTALEIAVKSGLLKNGDTVVPETKREGSKITYSLLAGIYSFTISAPGHKTQRKAEWVIDENTALEYTYQVKLEAFKQVTSIKLSNTDLMQRGTYNLNELATVEPADASSKEPITWSVAEGKYGNRY